MKKRILAVVLILCMVTMWMPTTATAAGSGIDTLIQRIETEGSVENGFKYISLEAAFDQISQITYRDTLNDLDFYFTYTIPTSIGSVKQWVSFSQVQNCV